MFTRFLAALLIVVSAEAADLRVGVLSVFRPERVTVRSTEPLVVQAGARSLTLAPGQVAGLRAVGSEIDLFALQQTSTANRVVISGRGGAAAPFRLTVDGTIDRTFNGRLEVSAVGSRLEPVVLVDLEVAVAAQTAAELPYDAPVEALKAMAVIARSNYLAGGRRHGSYDLCDNSHCQRLRDPLASDHPAVAASRQTEGIVTLYMGRPFAAAYTPSCGGPAKSAEQARVAGPVCLDGVIEMARKGATFQAILLHYLPETNAGNF